MSKRNRMTQDEKESLGGCLLFFLCGLCSVMAYFYWNAQAPFEGEITHIHWDYAWDIEEWRAVNHRCETRGCEPAHSYNHSTTTSCNTINKVRTCDTDYRYTINEWVVVATEHAAGEGNLNRPYYPELTLVRAYGQSECPLYLEAYSPNSPMFGCQRAGQQHPHHYYDISTSNLEKNFSDTCELSRGLWTELSVRDLVIGQYFSNRKRINCDSVEF